MMGYSARTMLLAIFQASMMMVESKSYCTKGFPMDIFCIDLGTLLDNPSLKTLPNPDQHSVHCLVDVKSCVDSGYRVLVKPPGYQIGDDYIQDVELDVTGNNLVVAEARRLGSCGTCDGGSLTRGFAATFVGTLDEGAIPGSEQEVAASDVVPPILYVTEVLPFDSPCPENPSSMPSTLPPSPPPFNAPTPVAVTMNPTSSPSPTKSPPDASNAPTPAAVTMNPASSASPTQSFGNVSQTMTSSAPSPMDASDAAAPASVAMNPASSASPTQSFGSVWQTMIVALALVPILSGMFVLLP